MRSHESFYQYSIVLAIYFPKLAAQKSQQAFARHWLATSLVATSAASSAAVKAESSEYQSVVSMAVNLAVEKAERLESDLAEMKVWSLVEKTVGP